MPLHALFYGQFASSMLVFLPLFLMNPVSAYKIVLPLLLGTKQYSELYNTQLYKNPCCTHDIAHSPFFALAVKFLKASRLLLLQSQMTAISVLLQFCREAGNDLSGHAKSSMVLIAYKSQDDQIANTGGITQLTNTPNLLQFSNVSIYRHSSSGGWLSTNAILRIGLQLSTPGVEFVHGFRQSDTNCPLSNITQRASLWVICLWRVFAHTRAAIAPADVPARTILFAEQREYLALRYLKCSRVLFMPRRYSCVPLKSIGFNFVP